MSSVIKNYGLSSLKKTLHGRRDLTIATATMSKLSKGEEVALSVLLRICEYLDSDIGDICSVIKQKKEDTV